MSSSKAPISLAARLALGAAAWCAIALAVTGVLLTSLFRDHVTQEFDAGLRERLVELVALAKPSARGGVALEGELPAARFNRPFSGWAWRISAKGRALAQSRSLGPRAAQAGEAFAPPMDAVGDFTAPGGVASRGVSRAITFPNRAEPLIFAIAGPRAAIDDALTAFNRVVVLSLAALGVGLVGAVLFLLRAGLKPLEALRAKVARMREGAEPEAEAWPRELAPVAEELDELQGHVARLVERGRGQAADLAHAVKTPLAVLDQIAAQAPPGEAEPIRRQLARIGAYLNRHLSRARLGGGLHRRAPIAPCIEDILFALAADLDARGVVAHRDVEPGLRFIGDESDLFELTGNLLDNAAKWARAEIHVTARRVEEGIELAVADDGPGVPAAARDAIFARGHRLDETRPGQGLGLTIVREIAEAYGGRVEIGASAAGGARIALALPGDAAPAGARATSSQPQLREIA